MIVHALKSKKSGNYFIYDSLGGMYVDDARPSFNEAPTFFDVSTLRYSDFTDMLLNHTLDDVDVVQLRIYETGFEKSLNWVKGLDSDAKLISQ